MARASRDHRHYRALWRQGEIPKFWAR